MVERELLPLRGSEEWGNGRILVTTNNAKMIPRDISVSTVETDILSAHESVKLVEKLAGYKLAEQEKENLRETARNKNWRYLPPIMAT